MADDTVLDLNFVKELFRAANAMADNACKKAESLKLFLDVSATGCGRYSVANRHLIAGYKPDATDVRKESEWNSMGIKIREDATKIYLLEKRGQDKTIKSYASRVAYDISDTDAAVPDVNYDRAYLTESILKNSPCRIKYYDSLPDSGVKGRYRADMDEIAVTGGFKSHDEIIYTLAREMAHADFYAAIKTAEEKKWKAGVRDGSINPSETFKPQAYRRRDFITHAEAAAYVVAAHYKLNTDLRFNEIPEGFYDRSVSEMSGYTNYDAINERIQIINKTLETVTAAAKKTCERINRGAADRHVSQGVEMG